MLRRLRLYFPEFFDQFGCQLWFANIILTFPLTFRAIFDALNFSDSWNDFWEASYYRLAGFNILIFAFGTYLPIIAQISSLIFGFVRHKQVKVFKSSNYRGRSPSGKSNIKCFYDTEDDQSDHSSTFRKGGAKKRNIMDNSNKYGTDSLSDSDLTSVHSYFDPPIENYRAFNYNQPAAGYG